MADEQIPLREHFAEKISWLDRYFDQRLKDVKEAIDKAETQLNLRLQGMNELREQLNRRETQFVTRSEHEDFNRRITVLEQHDASGEGRSKATAVYWAIGASILTAMIVLLLSKLLIK